MTIRGPAIGVMRMEEEGLNQSWLIPHDEYQKLDRQEAGRREAYRTLFKSGLDASDMKAIRDSAHKGLGAGERAVSKHGGGTGTAGPRLRRRGGRAVEVTMNKMVCASSRNA